ncbi:MAG: glycoside hydrolase family 88 protein [Bacteroidales bacterium]|nr:glycoside hydrolase family 88 protein [Bacteroidales bacterium]
MRKTVTIIVAAMLLAACSPRIPLFEEVVASEMARNPEASYIDGQQGKLKWNYTTGLELAAMLDVYHTKASNEGFVDMNDTLMRYVDDWYDAIIDDNGNIYKYKKSNYSLDHICPGRTLFTLYDLTGKEKYRRTMDTLYSQLKGQPRTKEGGFWHKKIYPEQMWLDGLYMAQPFYAEYTKRYVKDPEERAANFADIANQFVLVAEYTYDPATGLYRHAWDSSHRMFWCNPATGQSDHAWGRALGWYMMALVDVLPLLPEDTPGRDRMLEIYRNLCDILPGYADPKTGMWYQVLDRPGAEGNYVEATASAMFIYAMAKGCRFGYVACRPYVKKVYRKLKKTFVTREGGLVNLNRCCEVAGLGGKDNRRGDYDYYINEKIRSNDPKGIGPLIWAALEIEQPYKR